MKIDYPLVLAVEILYNDRVHVPALLPKSSGKVRRSIRRNQIKATSHAKRGRV
jgi:hypothetical protein